MTHWPQLVVLAMMLLSFAMHCDKSGQPRDPYNPVIDLVNSAIMMFILIEGGFFASFGWSL